MSPSPEAVDRVRAILGLTCPPELLVGHTGLVDPAMEAEDVAGVIEYLETRGQFYKACVVRTVCLAALDLATRVPAPAA